MATPETRQTDVRSTHWILTWNNPPKYSDYDTEDLDDEDRLLAKRGDTIPFLQKGLDVNGNEEYWNNEFNVAHHFGWTFDGQLEVGANGTPHYQFYLDTKRQMRFAAVKKVFPACHIEASKHPKKVESYCKKLDTRSAATQTESQTDIPKYTTKDFWEDLSKVWPDFRNESEDEMECFDSAVRCLVDIDIPCYMLAVQPQVRKAFQLYGHRIMAQFDRKFGTDEKSDNVLYETSGPLHPNGKLYESLPASPTSEGSEESDEEDGEGSHEDSEDSGSEDSEGSSGDEVLF